MRVAIIGASGKVGKIVARKLKENKMNPLAITRGRDKEYFAQNDIKMAVVDLTSTVDIIAKAIEGYNAVVFSAGAGGKGLDSTFAIDLDGAVKVMEACEISKVKRFVMVSALEADNRDFWYSGPLRSYYIAKKYADRELKRTSLDWTILQPGQLEDNGSTGKVSSDYTENISIYREDVAECIVGCLKNDNTIHKVITVVNGGTPIDKYLAEI